MSADQRSTSGHSASASAALLPADHLPCGRHQLVTLLGCCPALLDDPRVLEALVHQAATATGATVLSIQVHRFTPHGCTVLAMLAESHASLHTYPETGVAFWDCFTCGSCDPERALPILEGTLSPAEIRQQIVTRRA